MVFGQLVLEKTYKVFQSTFLTRYTTSM